MHVVTFSNLFPSSVMPTHGLFVYERMRRVAASLGCKWTAIAPVPNVFAPLRSVFGSGSYQDWAKVPQQERWPLADSQVTVHHARFRHWPGLSQRRQADAVAAGARSLVRELANDGGVVLDAHYLWPDGVAAAKLAAEFGVPFTLTARGSDVNVLGLDAYIASRIAEAAGRAHRCMAVSDALAARFAEIASLPKGTVQTVRNGVDLERFQPGDVAAARAQFGLPQDRKIVLAVGRLVAGKGFAEALRAVRQLPDTVLALVGDGPERSALATEGGEQVCLLGTRGPDEVALAYRAADAFVLPSHREGWPNVVTEALASGLPVIATRVGGIPQILAADHDAHAQPEGHLGALVDVGDVEGLRVALARVLAQPAQRSLVRAFAHRYGWREPIDQLAAIFRSACGEEAA